jgi:hypothetical protein
MLVVLLIMSIIIVATSAVFSSVSRAISIGAGQSQIISNGRAIGDYLYHDFQQQVGPSSGGFIIITCRKLTAKLQSSDTNTVTVRDDELTFVRTRGGDLQSQTANASNALHALVTYGHAAKLDGTTTYTPTSDSPGYQNYPATDWILMRQALLLNSTSGLPTTGNATNATGALPANNANLLQGKTDVASCSLLDLTTYLRALGTKPGAGTFATNAPNLTYGSSGSAPNYNYLWARRFPFASSGAPGLSDFSQNNVNQMHAYFAGQVSDFRVDFWAMPTDNTGNPTSAAGKWYSIDTTGSDAVYPAPTNGQRYTPGPTAVANGGQMFVFEHGDVETLANGTGSPSSWPYMIRVRYRVHDAAAKISGSDGFPGRVFEQILYVNRE